jgi:UDP-N-acetylmuramate dehydrogenase
VLDCVKLGGQIDVVEESLMSNVRGKVLLCEPLANHTTFSIGGKCRAMVVPADEGDICTAIGFAKKFNIPWFVIGNGSNLLVSDDGFGGIVIKLAQGFTDIRCEEDCLVCGAAVRLPRICRYAASLGLSGIEFAVGIPASLGGALAMNAGTPQGAIGDVVRSLVAVSSTGDQVVFKRDELEFGYRSSMLRNRGYIITEAVLQLNKGSKCDIDKTMNELLLRRRRTQPLDIRNAGSIFKNPSGEFAGELIERVGLKGTRYGDAEISSKHANFIVNLGNAKASDVLALIELARSAVRETFDIELELEIECVGFGTTVGMG